MVCSLILEIISKTLARSFALLTMEIVQPTSFSVLLILWQLSSLDLVTYYFRLIDLVWVFQMEAFPKDPSTNLSIIPPNSSLPFRLPSTLALDRTERLYFDNILANNKNPSLPTIMTSFANYLHRKNLLNKLAKPTLRPQSLDAYLELKHTVEILTQ